MRGKLQRFEENRKRHNVLEPGKIGYEETKGSWKTIFKNENDIVLEVGCGKGEYTVGLARVLPHRNFIGIDIKGDRIWVGSKIAEEEQLPNAFFLRTELSFLGKFFESEEVSEIWITFPDPRPKKREMKRRLTHPRFMELYRGVLKKDGWIKFKTDNGPLFEYTLETLSSGELKVRNLSYTFDLYNSPLNEEHHGIKTKYEQMFHAKGEKIKYMKFQFV